MKNDFLNIRFGDVAQTIRGDIFAVSIGLEPLISLLVDMDEVTPTNPIPEIDMSHFGDFDVVGEDMADFFVVSYNPYISTQRNFSLLSMAAHVSPIENICFKKTKKYFDKNIERVMLIFIFEVDGVELNTEPIPIFDVFAAFRE